MTSPSVTDSAIFANLTKIGDKMLTDAVLANSASNTYGVIRANNISNIKFANTITPICFYDNEVLGSDVTMTSNVNLKSLTTAQCMDANFLQSIGYVMVV